jgi:hypothetical protein
MPKQRTLTLTVSTGIRQQPLKLDIHLSKVRTTHEQIAIQNKHMYVVMLLQQASDSIIGRSTGTIHQYSVKLRRKQYSASLQRQSHRYSKQWLLHRACALGDVATAENLLVHGVNANKRENHGYSPIHYACIPDGSKLIELLKAHDVSVNKVNSDRKTALQIALEINNLQAAFCLLSYGCAIPRGVLDCRNSRGNTLLHIALQTKPNVSCTHVIAIGCFAEYRQSV